LTKIYCYCLFDGHGIFHGVYSSVNAVHRDALKLCNKGTGNVLMEKAGQLISPSVKILRNTLKGAFDVQVIYTAGHSHKAQIIKTKLKE
jgi:hypothetical protein